MQNEELAKIQETVDVIVEKVIMPKVMELWRRKLFNQLVYGGELSISDDEVQRFFEEEVL